MPVVVTPTILSPLHVMSFLVSVNVGTASGGRPAQIVKKTTGGIQGLSVELVTVTGVASRHLSATV